VFVQHFIELVPVPKLFERMPIQYQGVYLLFVQDKDGIKADLEDQILVHGVQVQVCGCIGGSVEINVSRIFKAFEHKSRSFNVFLRTQIIIYTSRKQWVITIDLTGSKRAVSFLSKNVQCGEECDYYKNIFHDHYMLNGWNGSHQLGRHL